MGVLSHSWPWYISGPLIGLMVPALLLVGNKVFGISSTLRHVCAATMPGRVKFFRYDWREGGWNLVFTLGIALGGALAARFLMDGQALHLAPAARASIAALGIHDFSGLAPHELFRWQSLATARGILAMVGGGLLVGFGAAYAGGCTSGHAISGLADFQLPSLIAVLGFFAGGLISTWFVLPRLLRV